MNGSSGKSGFTLLEMLAAAVLLGVVVVALTTVFRQTMIAQSVGEAAIADSSRQRREISVEARLASDMVTVIDGAGTPTAFRVLSVWDADGKMRETRPLAREDSQLPDPGTACWRFSLTPMKTQTSELVTVVVTSAGPDGKWGTEDDLSTNVPEGVE